MIVNQVFAPKFIRKNVTLYLNRLKLTLLIIILAKFKILILVYINYYSNLSNVFFYFPNNFQKPKQNNL